MSTSSIRLHHGDQIGPILPLVLQAPDVWAVRDGEITTLESTHDYSETSRAYLQAIEDYLDQHTGVCMVVLELVMSCNGLMVEPNFARDLEALLVKKGVALIVDECYTFGRVCEGFLSLSPMYKLRPHAIVLGKVGCGLVMLDFEERGTEPKLRSQPILHMEHNTASFDLDANDRIQRTIPNFHDSVLTQFLGEVTYMVEESLVSMTFHDLDRWNCDMTGLARRQADVGSWWKKQLLDCMSGSKIEGEVWGMGTAVFSSVPVEMGLTGDDKWCAASTCCVCIDGQGYRWSPTLDLPTMGLAVDTSTRSTFTRQSSRTRTGTVPAQCLQLRMLEDKSCHDPRARLSQVLTRSHTLTEYAIKSITVAL